MFEIFVFGNVSELIRFPSVEFNFSVGSLGDDIREYIVSYNLLFNIFTCVALQTVRSFLPNMLEKNKGHIVNITSLAGSFPVCNLTDYCASKFGATGFSHSLALELYEMGKTGIKVTCIQPHTTNTGLVWHPKTR